MKTVAIVPARAGSKGLPNKNIARIGDSTLLELAVRVGKACSAVDDLYVSTDSPEYEALALRAGAKSLGLRDASLSGDAVRTVDVVIDLVRRLERSYDYLVLLQPTSPGRTPDDISALIRLVDSNRADGGVSLHRVQEPHPYKLKRITPQGLIEPFIPNTSSEIPRQDLPAAYALNGSLYVVRTSALLEQRTLLPRKTLPYLMEPSVNINTEGDLRFLRYCIEQGTVSLYGQ